MHVRSSLMFAVVAFAVTSTSVSAQSAPALAQERAGRTPAQLLQPQAASPLLAPVDLRQAVTLERAPNATHAQPVVAARGQGFGLMIAGGALFVAGLLVGGGAGTAMAVGGAGIGAYGLYLYFR